ncbi:hypothetical protein AOLI_G00282990 [Acnodon oligacanthus]
MFRTDIKGKNYSEDEVSDRQVTQPKPDLLPFIRPGSSLCALALGIKAAQVRPAEGRVSVLAVRRSVRDRSAGRRSLRSRVEKMEFGVRSRAAAASQR